MERNLTKGSVLKNLVLFSLPYLLSYFLQTLYGMADLFIIGQYEGVASTTAVSVGSQVMHMLTVMIVGLAMGTTVNIGRAVGAEDGRDAAMTTGNTVTLFMALSVALSLILLLSVRAIVSVISTPTEAVDGTMAYLTICFVGIPFITAYNIISSIFRGMGDSKSPMYFIAIACAANIIIDYVFMGIFHLVPSSMLSAVSALGAQNIGADKPKRAVQTLKYAMMITTGFGLIVTVIMQFAAEPIVALFTDTDALGGAEVIRLGGQYLRGYIWDCVFAGIHFSFSGYFCACGRSELSFLHNLIAIVCARVPGVYLASKLFPTTLLPMGLATATGSLISVIICVIAYKMITKPKAEQYN